MKPGHFQVYVALRQQDPADPRGYRTSQSWSVEDLEEQPGQELFRHVANDVLREQMARDRRTEAKIA